ncbi:acyl-CoA dehydrogenase family protein [Microbacterium sp. ASV49]|uniref:Acyl-CoA dehydrogenase family protein n=1 Tax=Microbacterium candidum TaxID=3041922 RepID=A0ABT7MWH0_9MICO|nr:acyl-CoA dehydrogenase family protein [Microbacterium sp. ASV49]MDL9978801.1 acyl-CoA dehydrogenase family protein [Microbacterium sp. ASV49]
MRRDVYGPEHEAFRQTMREFIAREVTPSYPEWERAGRVPRSLYLGMGELGVFGIDVPEVYGGAGEFSPPYALVIEEESCRAGVILGAWSTHTHLVLPYLKAFATPEQMHRWMPGFMSGEMMTALAMTEPGTGSDVAGIRTSARLSEDGTHYVVNGAKTFITGGVQADRILTVCRTSPATEGDRRGGLTLLFIDTTSEGFSVSRALDKLGQHASDTGELSFVDVKVPVGDRVGEEGKAFGYLAINLVQERLGCAAGAYAQAAAAIGFALEYTRSRQAFGQPIASFQNTKFELAACSAEVEALQAMLDRATRLFETGELDAADAARLKLFATEVAGRVVDRCLQLHGGYGYMNEYPIARLYADTRVTRIYAGSNEIMKTIIAKSMGL